MRKRLVITYKSGRFTVALPVLTALIIWIGGALTVFALSGWNMPDWAGVLTCGTTFILALVMGSAIHKLFLRLAGLRRGELILEGDHLRWRTGRRWREVDFSQPHHVQIAAGHSGMGEPNANITLYPDVQQIHLRGAWREEILQHFPEPYFVDELATLPEEGGWGFEARADDPVARDFFFSLLECLWRNRHNNRSFQAYARYPWDRPPNRPSPTFA